MNEQLEKCLLPYLPYRLRYQKVSSGHFAGDPDRVEIKEWHYNDIQDLFKKRYQVKSVKAILRPLSDLTKEIEVNGKRFIPIDWLEDTYYTLDYRYQCRRLLEEDGENWINQCDYMLVEHLIEWHFDVFDLIPQNLAIDINSLK